MQLQVYSKGSAAIEGSSFISIETYMLLQK